MYRRVLIPLDGSSQAERVFDQIQEELAPDGEVILLRVIRPGKTRTMGGQILPVTQQEEAERFKVKAGHRSVIAQLGGDNERWRYEVVISGSVSQCIVDFAKREGVDLIAMYTHDRRELAALIKNSIAKGVQRKASIEVKVFKPRELAAVT